MLNSAPVVHFIMFDPDPPGTNANLSASIYAWDADNDPLTFDYVWKVNNQIVRTVNNTSATTDALDLSLTGNGDKGDTIALYVTPHDGTTSGTTASNFINVGNTEPSLTNPGNLTSLRGQDIFVQVLANDPDNETLTYSAYSLPTGLSIHSNTGIISGTISSSADTVYPYPATVMVSDGTDIKYEYFSWSIHHQIDLSGAAVVGLERQALEPVVATFTTDHSWATATDFSATVLWGDGTTSAGTISANGGVFEVSAAHTYARKGSYAGLVRVHNSLDGGVNIAPLYVVVLPLEDPTRVQTLLDSDLDFDGSLNAAIFHQGDGTFEITGTGSYTYTLSVSLTDGLYSIVDAELLGDMDLEFTLAGTYGTSTLSLGNYTLTEEGMVEIDRLITTSDLAGQATRGESGVLFIDSWSKTGDDALGTYTISAFLTQELEAEEEGIYGGLRYLRAEEISGTILLEEEGDYLLDFYAETQEITLTTTWTETGSHWSEDYEQDGTGEAEFTIEENGDFTTGGYTVAVEGTAEGSLTGSFSNGVAEGTMNAGGDPVVISINKTADRVSGAYTLTHTVNSTSSSGGGDVSNQTAEGQGSWGAATSVTLEQTGNTLNGAYELTVETIVTGTNSWLSENQDASASGASTWESSTLWEQEGNVLTGAYSLESTTEWENEWTSSAENQDAESSSSGSAFGTSTLVRSGNTQTGAYSFTLTTSSTATNQAEGNNQDATFSVNATTEETSEAEETGNTLTGAYSRADIRDAETTTVEESENQTASHSGETTLVVTTQAEKTGNRISGTFSLAQTSEWSSSAEWSGTDARGAYTGESTSEGTGTLDHAGNHLTGSYELEASETWTTEATQSGGNADTTYEQVISVEGFWSREEEFNAVSGAYAHSSSSFSTTVFTETGDYLGLSFSIARTDTVEETLENLGNSITGEYESEGTLETTSELYAFGDNGTNSYEHWKTSNAALSWSSVGNDITGGYITVGASEEGSTVYEENTYADGDASFTEVLFESFDFTETGNAVTGEYERDETDGVRTSSLEAETTDATGTYTVSQTVVGTFTRTATGNRVTGDYLRSETAEDEYEVEQTGVGSKNYTFTMNGTHAYTDEEEGNTVTGLYTRTKEGTDEYEIEITGTKTGGSYVQTVSGEEAYILVDEGNLATGNYERTIEGEGTYSRTSTGAGATEASGTGAIDYLWEQGGDPHSGFFTLDQTGVSRYDLLEDFHDISNTDPDKSPGHMNWYPFGQTFVDPGPGIYPSNHIELMRNPEYARGMAQSIGDSYLGVGILMSGASMVAGASRGVPALYQWWWANPGLGAGAGGAGAVAGRIALQPNTARLVAIQNGRVIAHAEQGLSHAEFVRRHAVPPGAWVGTVVKDGGTIFGFNSRAIMGNQNVASARIIEILRNFFR